MASVPPAAGAARSGLPQASETFTRVLFGRRRSARVRFYSFLDSGVYLEKMLLNVSEGAGTEPSAKDTVETRAQTGPVYELSGLVNTMADGWGRR